MILKPSARYKDFRYRMMSTFKNYEGSSSFYSVFALAENINHIILDSCDGDGKTLDHYKITPANVLYQILRLAQRPIILRELEQTVPLIFKSHASLVEAISVLEALDLIEYNIRSGYEGPKNSLVISIKEEDDLNPHQPL